MGCIDEPDQMIIIFLSDFDHFVFVYVHFPLLVDGDMIPI